MIEITPQILFIQIIVFLVGMILVTKFFIKPLNSKLEERRKTIESNYFNADKVRRDAEKLEIEYKQRLTMLEGESRDLITKAMSEAEGLRMDIVKAAHEQARILLKKTEEELKSEKQVMMKELQADIGKLGILMAEKVLKRSFTDKDQEKLLNEITEDLLK